MKYIFVLLFFVSCTVTNTSTQNIHDLKGEYFGSAFQHYVFTSISNDTAIVDWIYIEKGPRDYIEDTIYISASKNNWKGTTTELFIEKNKLIVRTNSPLFNSKNKKDIFLAPNSNKYQSLPILKNNVLLYKSEHKILGLNKTIQNFSNFWIYRENLKSQYDLINKSKTMNHSDFSKLMQTFDSVVYRFIN